MNSLANAFVALAPACCVGLCAGAGCARVVQKGGSNYLTSAEKKASNEIMVAIYVLLPLWGYFMTPAEFLPLSDPTLRALLLIITVLQTYVVCFVIAFGWILFRDQ